MDLVVTRHFARYTVESALILPKTKPFTHPSSRQRRESQAYGQNDCFQLSPTNHLALNVLLQCCCCCCCWLQNILLAKNLESLETGEISVAIDGCNEELTLPPLHSHRQSPRTGARQRRLKFREKVLHDDGNSFLLLKILSRWEQICKAGFGRLPFFMNIPIIN